MRRLVAPFVVLLIAFIVGMLVFGLVSDGPPRKGSGQQKYMQVTKKTAAQQRAEALAANGAVLAEIPLPPDSRFYSRDDYPPPKGGSHITTHVHFTSPSSRQAVIDHFKSVMQGWTLAGGVTVPTRTEVSFHKGTAWVSVAAVDIDVAGKPTPGFTITVNAKDGEKMAAR